VAYGNYFMKITLWFQKA